MTDMSMALGMSAAQKQTEILGSCYELLTEIKAHVQAEPKTPSEQTPKPESKGLSPHIVSVLQKDHRLTMPDRSFKVYFGGDPILTKYSISCSSEENSENYSKYIRSLRGSLSNNSLEVVNGMERSREYWMGKYFELRNRLIQEFGLSLPEVKIDV